ncbi:MAG: right-handed parallel beta-helix repeat-containing protein, partial [Methanobrevibacter sp.]|nr:right-handed parallel beta-helix repeat-containing protein [Methanobrevibacter sp.]
MKRKNIILISLFLIIALINISIVSAEDFEEVNISDSLDENLEIIDNKDIDNQNYISQENAIDDESISDNGGGDEILKSSNTATDNLQSTSYVDGKAYNQMSNPTIQTAINNAKDGDTIIITGTAYVHCHFIVNKKLTIISEVGTTMSPCPSNTDGSGAHGIFYISPEASGTVIKGFELLGNDQYSRENDYGIYIKGASNVQIVNCSISTEIADGIRLANATNTQITDSIIKDSNIGINIVDSTKTIIRNNNITNNTKTGINISGSTKNTTIDTNNITYNQGRGISITTADYIYILNNFIAFNQKDGSGAGVYVNCNITKIEILGNLFRQNGQYGVLNDYRTRNMGWQNGAEKLEVVNNNYFMGHTERTVYHIEYKSSPEGSFNYDSGTDTYIFVGEGNGNFDIDKTAVYLVYAYLIDETICGATLYKAPNIAWNDENRNLQISEITQVKKGTYQVSITDAKGNVATDLSSIYVTFYLNKNNTESLPQEGDIFKTVLMKNGVATVSFSEKDYLESGNVLLAVFPGLVGKTTVDPHASFNIADDQLPKDSINTKITVSNMNTYPNSGASFTATIRDEYGNPLAGKTIKISLNGNTYTRTTDANGKVSIPIKLSSEKTYTITVSFNGDEEYNVSSAKASIAVKRTGQKIISSNKSFAPNKVSYYTFTLKDQ